MRFAPFSPGGEGSKECLDTGIGGMGTQFGRGQEAHKLFRFQPDAFAPHRPPEEDQRTAREFSTCVGQLLHRGGLANVDTAHIIEWFDLGFGLLFTHYRV